MIQALRLTVILSSLALAYLFGGVSENLLMLWLRRATGVDEGHMIYFHAFRIIASTLPLLLAALVSGLALSGEPAWKARFWRILIGILCSIIFLQIYFSAWLIHVISQGPSAEEMGAGVHLTRLELAIPFMILSVFSVLFIIIDGQALLIQLWDGGLAILGALIWLWATGKLAAIFSSRSMPTLFAVSFLGSLAFILGAKYARKYV